MTVNREDALRLVVSLHRLLRGLRQEDQSGRLPPGQLVVLAILSEHGPLRIGELAKQVPCSQPTATNTIAELEPFGYVRREPDPTDGRAIRVVLTDEGRLALRSMAQSGATVMLERLKSLSGEEIAIMLAAEPIMRKLTGTRSDKT